MYVFAQKILCVFLALSLVSGCATRSVDFSSRPSGALVRVGEIEEKTPCLIKVPRKIKTAEVLFDSGEVQVIEIPPGPGPWDHTKVIAGKTTAYVLYGVSIPLVAVGFVSGVFFMSMAESGYTYSGGEEEGAILTALLIGASAGLFIGVPLYSAAEYIDENSTLDEPSVHAVSASAK